MGSGHYICRSKVDGNAWVEFNDSQCHSVAIRDVLSSQAYVLCYEKRQRKRLGLEKVVASDFVIPYLYWFKVKRFADYGDITDWSGPIIFVSEGTAEKYGYVASICC